MSNLSSIFCFSEEEGDAMLRVRDSEDVKGLGRIGLNRADFGDEEAMKLGFPLGQALGINAVDTRSMPTLDYNVDAVVAGRTIIFALTLCYLKFLPSINCPHIFLTVDLVQ